MSDESGGTVRHSDGVVEEGSPFWRDLADWLVKNGYAEPRPGFGHVDGATLATALIERYRLFRRNEPTTQSGRTDA